MAVKIEANGAALYRKASQLQKDKTDKEFLETLAKMEDRHQAVFEENHPVRCGKRRIRMLQIPLQVRRPSMWSSSKDFGKKPRVHKNLFEKYAQWPDRHTAGQAIVISRINFKTASSLDLASTSTVMSSPIHSLGKSSG